MKMHINKIEANRYTNTLTEIKRKSEGKLFRNTLFALCVHTRILQHRNKKLHKISWMYKNICIYIYI